MGWGRPLKNGETAFLLRKSANGRYFENGLGQPVFLHGDTAWSLLVNCTLSEAITYLDDCQSRGVNFINCNLLEHAFTNNSPAHRNANGDLPFSGTAFQSSTVAAYFSHVLAVVRAAAARSIVVVIWPCYLGFNGGSEGWQSEIQAANATQAQDWGVFVGNLFRKETNVMYCMLGDYDPPSHARSNSIRTGILSAHALALFAAHGAPDQSGHDIATSWTQDFDFLYEGSAGYTHVEALDGYAVSPARPVVLGEARYKQHDSNPQDLQLRCQAWGAFCGGACGHLYGHEYIWAFNDGSNPGAGIFDDGQNWTSSLAATSRAQMQHLRTFVNTYTGWYATVPDTTNTFVTAGRGTLASADYRTARFSSTLGIVHVRNGSSGGSFTVDRTEFSAAFTCLWFNPRSGAAGNVAIASGVSNAGTQSFTPPDTNDWVWVGFVP